MKKPSGMIAPSDRVPGQNNRSSQSRSRGSSETMKGTGAKTLLREFSKDKGYIGERGQPGDAPPRGQEARPRAPGQGVTPL